MTTKFQGPSLPTCTVLQLATLKTIMHAVGCAFVVSHSTRHPLYTFRVFGEVTLPGASCNRLIELGLVRLATEPNLHGMLALECTDLGRCVVFADAFDSDFVTAADMLEVA